MGTVQCYPWALEKEGRKAHYCIRPQREPTLGLGLASRRHLEQCPAWSFWLRHPRGIVQDPKLGDPGEGF